MNLHSYPKVYAIGHSAVLDLFQDPVLVEEKIDGSQFSFAIAGGELAFRSRGAEIHADGPEAMFAAGVNSVKEISDRLHDGWVYRCEYLQKAKHNALSYGRVPHRNLILFDINTGDEIYLSREAKEREAERVGLEIVPVLHIGQVLSQENLLALLERESCLGGVKVEGIVAKNYLRFGKDKKVLMGKYVREDYKEKHSKSWRAANPSSGDIIGALAAALRNENRWKKSVQHLRERGELENSPRDIGKLIVEAKRDIVEEESDAIRDKLYKYAIEKITRGAVAGIAEWYKKELLASAFEKPGEVSVESSD